MIEEGQTKMLYLPSQARRDACLSPHAMPQPLPSSGVGDALPGQAPAVVLSHPKSSLAFRKGSCLLEGAR